MREFLRHYFGGLYHRIGQQHVFLLAGGLAFSFLVCVVPLVLVFLSILGNVLAASSFEYRVDMVIEMLFPYTQYVASLKAFLISRVDEIVTYRDLAGYGGVLGLVLAATGLFSSMRTILNRIFQVNKDKHLVVGKLRDFGMVLLVLLFFLISTTIFPLLEFMRDSAHRIAWLQTVKFNPSLQGLFPILFFVIVFALFYILYYFVPYEKLGIAPTIVSALFATVFWEIAKRLFGYYLSHAATLDRVYGAYIFTVAVVLWIYYSSLVFILGAEIGQLYRERMPSGENKMLIGIDALDL